MKVCISGKTGCSTVCDYVEKFYVNISYNLV